MIGRKAMRQIARTVQLVFRGLFHAPSFPEMEHGHTRVRVIRSQPSAMLDGRKIVVRQGKWVDAKTGAPVN